MKIGRTENSNIHFEDLKTADVFRFKNERIYMKLEKDMYDENAVDLCDGMLTYFEDTDVVTKLNATLVIEKD